MTAPVRPLTMRDVLRAYALGERMNDWVLASRAVSHLVPQGSPNYDLCAEMCRLHASTCENDFIGLAEHIVNDATLARLAEVERERDEARKDMETQALLRGMTDDALYTAEQRLARLRPLVRWAFGVWDWLWGSRGMDGEDGWDLAERAEKCGLAARVKYDPEVHGETEADPGDEILYPGDFDPTDRAWATEEER